ncbi:MAG TPA: hypothetical protein VFJ67_04750 [Thermodesulfobacteriota bacterium]|nr:hypothetical protein [Thermodesulfobacteriota bacterium]
MRKYMFVIPFIFLALGCNDGGGGENRNFCYLPDASDPCFDENEGGSTTIVTDQTVDEVLAEEEGMPGFEDELEIDDILNGLVIPRLGEPNCPFEQSELVIKTAEEWNRFRNSCFFGMFDLPDVDFSESMVLVSTQNFAEFGTTIEAVLEFDNKLIAVVEDEVPTVPPPGPGFPFDIVSIPRRDLPVDFIRVEIPVGPVVE